jgi:hypothetical protein
MQTVAIRPGQLHRLRLLAQARTMLQEWDRWDADRQLPPGEREMDQPPGLNRDSLETMLAQLSLDDAPLDDAPTETRGALAVRQPSRRAA